jgi:disulfide bond formation protein DsbB
MKVLARSAYFSAFLLVGVLIGIIYYLEKYDGINPCPLCILQRFALLGLGVVFLAGTLVQFKKWGNLILSVISYLLALAGLLLAGRQVWLQHLPANKASDCGASLQYMLQAFPLKQVLQKILTGSAECSAVDWRFLNLSLAEWSVLAFATFLFFTACQFFASWRFPTRRLY